MGKQKKGRDIIPRTIKVDVSKIPPFPEKRRKKK